MPPSRCRSRFLLTNLSIALTAAMAAGPLAAQEPPSGEATDEAQDGSHRELERIQVTGSNIKRVDTETASPVQVIRKQEIERMGARTVLQILDNLPAAKMGQQDSKSLFTGSDGASQANLRGLGAQGTLVLLNGRRLSYYGAPEGFQTQFVNIDTIPAAVVERVEVLTDGASAIYGTDAVAGVVNIITKNSYQGAEFSLSTDWAPRIKSYGEHQASIVGGFGDIDSDHYNVFGSLNFYRRDPIPFRDVYKKKPGQYYINNPDFISELHLGTGSAPGVFNPGSYFAFDPISGAINRETAPGCRNVLTSELAGPRCIWETWLTDQTDGSKSERVTAYLKGTFRINDTLEAFAEATYTDIDLTAKGGTPRAFNSGGGTTSWFSRNTGTTVNTFTFPFLGPNNVYNNASPDLRALMGGVVGLNYLMQDVGDSHYGQRNTDKSYRALTGLRGEFGDWGWEIALTTAGTHSVTYQTYNVNLEGFARAFGPFTVDPVTGRTLISDRPVYQFGVISEANAALIRDAFPTFDIHSWTRLTTLDGKIEGPVGTLPAGDLRAAFGFTVSRESFYTPGNPDAANGLITQQGGSFFDGKRTTGALFAEAVAPLTEKLEVDAAIRLDKYPNFSANLAPKIGIKYRARPGLLLRGTYSEGFRAPSLAESGTGGIFAQLGGFLDQNRCDETNAIANLLLQSSRPGDIDLGTTLLNADCSRTVARLTQPNPKLKPEKAKIATLGFIFEPTTWLSVSADYWFIYRRDQIASPDFNRGMDILSSTRFAINDADRANLAALAAMCADPTSGVTCPAVLPTYSVGNVSSVVGQYKNLGRTLIDGFDIDARSRFSLNEWGKLSIGMAATIARRDEAYLDDDQRWYFGNTVGYYGNPRLRATLDAEWIYDNWTTSLFFNYTGRTKWAFDRTDVDSLPGKCMAYYGQPAQSQCSGVPSWWTANLGVAWQSTEKLGVRLNVKNLFNRLPFYDPNSSLGDASDYTNAFGRAYSVSMDYKF